MPRFTRKNTNSNQREKQGVVWTGWHDDIMYTFKVKGESHSTSKVKTLSPVDEAYENNKIEFANYATPSWRLEQMYAETFDTINGGIGSIKQTGDFLRAVINDVIKEESSEMNERNLTNKEVNPMISKIARSWFLDKLNSEI